VEEAEREFITFPHPLMKGKHVVMIATKDLARRLRLEQIRFGFDPLVVAKWPRQPVGLPNAFREPYHPRMCSLTQGGLQSAVLQSFDLFPHLDPLTALAWRRYPDFEASTEALAEEVTKEGVKTIREALGVPVDGHGLSHHIGLMWKVEEQSPTEAFVQLLHRTDIDLSLLVANEHEEKEPVEEKKENVERTRKRSKGLVRDPYHFRRPRRV
jgi:hypothetical protein